MWSSWHCDKNYVYRYDECQHIVQDGMKKSNKGTSKGPYLKQKQYNCDVYLISSLSYSKLHMNDDTSLDGIKP